MLQPKQKVSFQYNRSSLRNSNKLTLMSRLLLSYCNQIRKLAQSPYNQYSKVETYAGVSATAVVLQIRMKVSIKYQYRLPNLGSLHWRISHYCRAAIRTLISNPSIPRLGNLRCHYVFWCNSHSYGRRPCAILNPQSQVSYSYVCPSSIPLWSMHRNGFQS